MLCERKSFGDFQVYLQRISMLKKNFGSCEFGRNFMGKTGPIWDSLTKSIYRKSLILKIMDRNSDDKNMPEEYRRIYEQVIKDDAASEYKQNQCSHEMNTSFLQTLIAGNKKKNQ